MLVACSFFTACESYGTWSGSAGADASGPYVSGGAGYTAQNGSGGSVSLTGNGTLHGNGSWNVGTTLTGSQNVNGATVSLSGTVNQSSASGTGWNVKIGVSGRF